MSFISYAQNFEDVMLWRALNHIESGFYIDVGANDPVIDSVTKAFYDKGWTGINIEPLERHIAELKIDRPKDINLQVGASNIKGQANIVIPQIRGWASLNENLIEKYQQADSSAQLLSIPIITLSEIIQEYASNREIHFLKIDVEGHEKEVIEGVDFEKYRPWILIIESTMPNSQIENHSQWIDKILLHGYEMVYFDGLNRFFCAIEHNYLKQCFSTPPNVFDSFIRFQEHSAIEKMNQIKKILNEQNG